MANPIVTVFGGSGFLGRHVVRRLAASGARLRVAVRDPEAAAFLKPLGDVGQIVALQTNVRDDASIARAIKGSDIVVNLVGILFESGRQTFRAVHVEGARRIACASKQANIRSLVHISAIGAFPHSKANYARTKGEGEAAVRKEFPKAVLLRPSIIFGPEDNFFNLFASLARLVPALPLIGSGKTRMQPVFVSDVAEAIISVLDNHSGKTFELGGPQIFTYRELMERTLKAIERQCLLISVPFWAARVMAFFFERMPKPLLTRDQVRLLEYDNIVCKNAKTFADLGITPTPLDAVLPNYLARFRPGGRKREDNFA